MYTLIAYKENDSGDRDYGYDSYDSEFIYHHNLAEEELIKKLVELYYKDFCRKSHEGSTDDIIILYNGKEIYNSWFGETTEGILKIAEDEARSLKIAEDNEKDKEKEMRIQQGLIEKEKEEREEFKRLSKKFGTVRRG